MIADVALEATAHDWPKYKKPIFVQHNVNNLTQFSITSWKLHLTFEFIYNT